jgi:hypothetical protein
VGSLRCHPPNKLRMDTSNHSADLPQARGSASLPRTNDPFALCVEESGTDEDGGDAV